MHPASCPTWLVGRSRSTVVDNGTYGVFALFLLKVIFKAKRTSVAVKAEGPSFVGDRVPVRKNDDRRRCEFREKGANGVPHGEDVYKGSAVLRESHDSTYTASHVWQELYVVT